MEYILFEERGYEYSVSHFLDRLRECAVMCRKPLVILCDCIIKQKYKNIWGATWRSQRSQWQLGLCPLACGKSCQWHLTAYVTGPRICVKRDTLQRTQTTSSPGEQWRVRQTRCWHWQPCRGRTPPVRPKILSKSGGVRMSLPTTDFLKPGAYFSTQSNAVQTCTRAEKQTHLVADRFISVLNVFFLRDKILAHGLHSHIFFTSTSLLLGCLSHT